MDDDFADLEKKLRCYVDKGRAAGVHEVRDDPSIGIKPDASHIKPLKRTESFA